MREEVIRIPNTRSGFVPFPEQVAQNGTEKRREQDVRMMKSPQHWPHALLPIKRYDRERLQMDHAVWDGTKMYENTNIFMALEALPPNGVETTPEALVEKGWTVD